MDQSANCLLGLFPAMGHIGGIQASGQIAWEGLSRLNSGGNRRTRLVCYEPPDGQIPTDLPAPSRASSKTGAIISALKNAGTAEDILVWHLGLLKIVPFINTNNSRVILFLHGVEAWRRHGRLTSRLLTRVDLFLSNSEYSWERFVENNPAFAKAEHSVVPLGIGSAHKEPATKPCGPVALMVGRMTRAEDYKGHREVLRVWPLVCEREPGAQLWIVGDGDLRGDLQQVASANSLNDGVKFLGAVSEERKEQLYLQSRCLLLPSRGEGFGFVYVEAMRAGRPCLVSTFDAGREVINPPESGLAANPDNPQELSDAISRLLADGMDWHRWSIAARHRYESLYTARHFQDRLLDALYPNTRLAEATG